MTLKDYLKTLNEKTKIKVYDRSGIYDDTTVGEFLADEYNENELELTSFEVEDYQKMFGFGYIMIELKY